MKKEVTKFNNIKDKIFTIRSMQVMLYSDLAELYDVKTKVLNQAVKRNIKRFPKDFMFRLTTKELENWMSQYAITNKEKKGLRKLPFAFTEQGVAMLSGILKSSQAIEVNIQIMRAFVAMRRYLVKNAQLLQKIESVEIKQNEHIGIHI